MLNIKITEATSNGLIKTAVFIESGYDDTYDDYVRSFTHRHNLVMGIPSERDQLSWSQLFREWFKPNGGR